MYVYSIMSILQRSLRPSCITRSLLFAAPASERRRVATASRARRSRVRTQEVWGTGVLYIVDSYDSSQPGLLVFFGFLSRRPPPVPPSSVARGLSTVDGRSIRRGLTRRRRVRIVDRGPWAVASCAGEASS